MELPQLQFGVLTDVQYADKPEKFLDTGVRRFRSLGLLDQAVDHFNSVDSLDFIVHLGDIIDGNETEERTQADFSLVTQHFSRLRTDRPVHHILGNHCLAIPRPQLYQSLGLSAPYHSFSLRGWRFVALDSVDASVKWPAGTKNHEEARRWLEAHAGQEKAQYWNGSLMKEQLDWLESELTLADQHRENVILFSHIPVVEGAATMKHLIFNDAEVLEILDRHESVFAWLSGHYHLGGYCLRKGVHHVTFEGVLEAPEDKNAFGIVELYTDRVVIRGHGVLTSRELLGKKLQK